MVADLKVKVIVWGVHPLGSMNVHISCGNLLVTFKRKICLDDSIKERKFIKMTFVCVEMTKCGVKVLINNRVGTGDHLLFVLVPFKCNPACFLNIT